MQELINRTSGVAENAISAVLGVAHLASYFGLSYLALTLLASFVSQLLPAARREQA